MAQVDFFWSSAGDVLVKTIDAIPGFTATSYYARLFAASGVAYPEVLRRLVDLVLERHESSIVVRRGRESRDRV